MSRPAALCGAFRGALAQAFCQRNAGSLLQIDASTSGSAYGSWGCSAGASAGATQATQRRHMKVSTVGGRFDPWAFFDYRKTVYPDVYDPNEALLCSRYKFHGLVAERFEPPSGPLFGAGGVNPLGDPELERRAKYLAKRLYATLVCSTSVWGFSRPKLRDLIADTYRAYNAALASGRPEEVREIAHLMSDSMLQRLQAEVAKRPRGMRVTWRLEAPPAPQQQQQQQQEGAGSESGSGSGPAAAAAAEMGAGRGAQTGATSPGSDVQVELVHGVVVPNPLRQGKLHFAQWTARIRSRQVVAVHLGDKLVSGDPHKAIDVEDYWVFERPILKAWIVPRPGPQDATWRLVERLSYNK